MSGAVSSLDWGSIGANVGVFLGAAGALFVGIKSGLKKIAKGEIEPTPSADKKAVAAATLIETTTLLMWSESNRDVCECIGALRDEIKDLRHEMEITRLTRK